MKESSSGKVVALLNQKGGVGKTTLAFNMAHALAKKGKRVLCLDMDPQANLGLLFGVETEEDGEHILHLLLNSIREIKAIHRPIVVNDIIQKFGDIDLLPSGQDLAGLELIVSAIKSPRQLILKRFIEKNGLLDKYDYIIIDGPPTLGLIMVNILCAAHGVLVPFQPDQFSRKGLGHFHEVIENIEDMGIVESPKIIGYIPNLIEGRRKQSETDFTKIRDELSVWPDAKIFDGFSNKVQLVKSSANGKSVFDYQSKEFYELQLEFNNIAHFIEERLS